MGVVQHGNREDRLRRLIPFAAIAVAPLVIAAITPRHPWALLVAGGLTVAVAVAVVVAPWERLPWQARIAPVVLYCGAVAFARHAQGGGPSTLTLLLLLPVLYVALYAEQSDVFAAITATTTTLAFPLLLVGAPEYPMSQWHGVAVWLMSLMGSPPRATTGRASAVPPWRSPAPTSPI